MGDPNWLRRDVEKVLYGMNELARTQTMVHARIATKVNERGELVIELVLPNSYAKAWQEPK